ncbi:MAG: hypothetical protein ACRCX2_00855, partial [Paraclostridium sp.]
NGKKVSTRTIKKYIKALSKCSMNILEPVKNFDDEVFYKINYSVDEKYYTLIHDVALRKLINAYSENSLKTYLVILYTCYLNNDKNKNGEIIYQEKHIDQNYLCEKIGLKTTSRKLITDCIEALAKGGFIKVRLEYAMHSSIKDGEVITKPISRYFYTPSMDYLKKNHITR